jgi:hypothetical protein
MTAEMRPQDPELDGSGLTFETLERGGEYQDAMPQAIRVTDAEGRWCIYELTMIEGHVVQSYGHSVTQEAERPISQPSRSPSPPCRKVSRSPAPIEHRIAAHRARNICGPSSHLRFPAWEDQSKTKILSDGRP